MRRRANSTGPNIVHLQLAHPFLRAFSTAFTAPGYDHGWAESQFKAAHNALKTGALHDIAHPGNGPSGYGMSEEDRAKANDEHRQKVDQFHRQVEQETGLPHPGPRPDPETSSVDELSQHFDRARAHRDAWENGIRGALTKGHVTIDQAEERGYRGDGREHGDKDYDGTRRGGWRSMPDKVFHVGTDADAIAEQGLKTRAEQGNKVRGLGGGTHDTVSVTSDPDLGPDIYHALHEHHAVVNGHVSVQQLHDYAKNPPAGQTPFHDRMIGGQHPTTIESQQREVKIHEGMSVPMDKLKKDKEAGRGPWQITSYHDRPEGADYPPIPHKWERPMDEKEKIQSRSEAYKNFAYHRDSTGGHRDPMFMSNDPHAFAATDSAKFGILHLRTHPGAQGYTHNATGAHHKGADSGEWRLGHGSPFDVEKIEKPTPRHVTEFGLDHKTAALDSDPDAHVKGVGADWRAELPPEHDDVLRKWERVRGGAELTADDRKTFRKLVAQAPEHDGVVYRGVPNLSASRAGFAPLMKKHQPGTVINIPRHSSTSTKEHIASGFSHVVYEIHGAHAKGIGNTLHEAVMPPGKFEVHSAEMHRDAPSRSTFDGKVIFPSTHLHVVLHPHVAKESVRRTAGTIDLYHRTTPEAAEAIGRERRMTSKENTQEAYFSTHRDGGEGEGYGEAVVHVRVPEHLAELDDEFPSGEQHYRVKVNQLRPEHFVRQSKVAAARPEHTVVPVGAITRLQGDDPDDEYMQDLTEHVRQHGVQDPLILHRNTKEDTLDLYEGHHTHSAATRAGLTHVPVEIHDNSRDAVSAAWRRDQHGDEWKSGYDDRRRQRLMSDMKSLGSMQMVRPSQVWDHVRSDHVFPKQHVVDGLHRSIDEHGYQPSWDHADGPIRVDLSGETPIVGNGSHRLHVLKQRGMDNPIPMQVTSSLSDEDRVSVAEEAMERGGHTGRSFHVPAVKWTHGDPLPESHREVHDYVNGVIRGAGHPVTVRVQPKDWNLRQPGSGQAYYDHNYGKIGLAGEDTHELTLLHEIAHAVSSTDHGPGGHGPAFQQAAHGLYGTHLGPEAADTFKTLLEPIQRREAAAAEEVHRLPVGQFMDKYPPGEYDSHGTGWEGVAEHPNFWKRNPSNYKRIHRGTWDAFVDHVRQHGIQEPVVVDRYNGEVAEGHHRVKAAEETGQDVPFTFTGQRREAGVWHPNGTRTRENWPPHLTEKLDEYGDLYPANVSRSNPRGRTGTEDDAKDAGLVGPYFHGTSKRRAADIRRGGFRQPRMHNYEMADAGTAEEVDLGHTHQTYFAENHDDAHAFARAHHGDQADVVTAYLHPDHVRDGTGWMDSKAVNDVAHTMAIRSQRKQASADVYGRQEALSRQVQPQAYGGRDEAHAAATGLLSAHGHPGADRLRMLTGNVGWSSAMHHEGDPSIMLNHNHMHEHGVAHEVAHLLVQHRRGQGADTGHDGEFEQTFRSLLRPEHQQVWDGLSSRTASMQSTDYDGEQQGHVGQRTAGVDDDGTWYHRSHSPTWSAKPEHALHVGAGHAALHMDSTVGGERKYLHRFKYTGQAHNSFQDPAVDYVANHAYHEAFGRNYSVSHSDPMSKDDHESLRWAHQQGDLPEPSGYVAEHVDAAKQGKGIYYTNVNEGNRATVSLVAPSSHFEHLGVEPISREHWDKFARAQHLPHERVFGPTYGLDHRLWDDEKLREEVRNDILARFTKFCIDHDYKHWSRWAKVVFFGSEASEWTSPELEGNGDFDLSLGIHYDHFRGSNGDYTAIGDQNIADMFTRQMHEELNDPEHVFPGIDGVYDNTWYANIDGWHIETMRPYAAWDVSARSWIVRPPHLPHWDWSKMPAAVQRVLKGSIAYARSVLALPEPMKTQTGAALYREWHEERSNAFGDGGQGWWAISNLREKALDQLGLWVKLYQCKVRESEGMDPVGWDNAAPFGVTAAAHPYTQQDWFHGGVLDGGRTLHDKVNHSGINRIHVGTHQAAMDRIDPDQWDEGDRSKGGSSDWVPHARLYRLRLAPGAKVCPIMHFDHDDAGSLDDFHCPHKDADVHPYVNEGEDNGSVSLTGRPSAFRVEEDLGRHPSWKNPETRARWGEPQSPKMTVHASRHDVSNAQRLVRGVNPVLQQPLGSEDDASGHLQSILRSTGHPAADSAFVVRHRDPSQNKSQVVYDAHTGAPGAALHPDRWDLSGLAHEAGHILHAHHDGVTDSAPDDVMHGEDYHRFHQQALGAIDPKAARDYGRITGLR